MKIAARFSLTISAIVLALLVGFVGALILTERRHLLEDSAGARREAAVQFGLVCQESVLSKDEILLVNYLKGLQNDPRLAFAFFSDPDGRVLVHTDLSQKGREVNRTRHAQASQIDTLGHHLITDEQGRALEEFVVPVSVGGRRLGVARVAYDAAAVAKAVDATLRRTAGRFAGVTILVLVLSLILALVVARSLARPIGRLTEGAQRLGEGRYDAVFDAGRTDEIGDLARSLSWAQGKLSELDKLKDEFISTVSHDLRNPLGAIKMCSQYLVTRLKPKKPIDKQMFASIAANTDTLRNMVDNILDTAKMRAGGMSLQKEPTAAQEVMAEIKTLYDPAVKEENKKLELTLPRDLPLIDADRGRFHRVVTNLLTNAFKFTRKGDIITLGARWKPGERMVKFFVTDTGIGIQPDKLKDLFDQFNSVGPANPEFRKQKGAGLGLSIVRAIVEAHGGRVWPESQVGKGTTFFFTWPAHEKGKGLKDGL